MNKFLISFMLSFIVVFFAKNAYAIVPGFEIPKWYSVDVKIVKPLDLQKKGDFGTLRFVFTPLIKADFEASVSVKGFKDIKITPESGKIYSKNMKEASIDFKFDAGSEIGLQPQQIIGGADDTVEARFRHAHVFKEHFLVGVGKG